MDGLQDAGEGGKQHVAESLMRGGSVKTPFLWVEKNQEMLTATQEEQRKGWTPSLGWQGSELCSSWVTGWGARTETTTRLLKLSDAKDGNARATWMLFGTEAMNVTAWAASGRRAGKLKPRTPEAALRMRLSVPALGMPLTAPASGLRGLSLPSPAPLVAWGQKGTGGALTGCGQELPRLKLERPEKGHAPKLKTSSDYSPTEGVKTECCCCPSTSLDSPFATKIGNKPPNTNVALRSRHSFISVLGAQAITPPNVHTWLTHSKAFYTFRATVINSFTVLLSYPRSYWFSQASSPFKVAASLMSDPHAQLTLEVVFGGPLVVFDSLPHDVPCPTKNGALLLLYCLALTRHSYCHIQLLAHS
ncbi:uncharacterized protein WM294_013798 [Sarcoramphus papa]